MAEFVKNLYNQSSAKKAARFHGNPPKIWPLRNSIKEKKKRKLILRKTFI